MRTADRVLNQLFTAAFVGRELIQKYFIFEK